MLYGNKRPEIPTNAIHVSANAPELALLGSWQAHKLVLASAKDPRQKSALGDIANDKRSPRSFSKAATVTDFWSWTENVVPKK